jgi:hypothetical protein
MKTALIASLCLVLGTAPGAFAATSQTAASCPAKSADEDAKAYSSRVNDYCEARWSAMAAAGQTAGQNHDRQANSCARRCDRKWGIVVGQELGILGAGILLLGGGALISASFSGAPASP